MAFLVIAALIPVIIVLVYVYRKDEAEPEPLALVFRVFGLGAISGIVAGFIESFIISGLEAVFPPGILLLVLTYFFAVAAVEEACKYFCLNTIKHNPAFNYVFDAIVYSVAAALGFAALENVFYVLDGGFETAVMRAIFSVPGHAADGVVMGVFYGIARQHELYGRKSQATRSYILAFVLPVIEHGFYDAALSTEIDMMAYVALAVDIAFIILAFILVRKKSGMDEPLHPSLVMPQQPVQQAPQPFTTNTGWYCPNCGTPNAQNFCMNCGTKRP